MGRAGIVIGYFHKCRRKGCGYEVKENHALTGRCPKCNMQLWAKPIPRHVRFHDLRHTTGTLLLKAGVPFATVQRMLRHTDPRLTTEIYGHLDVGDLRAGINKLKLTQRTSTVRRNANPQPVGEFGAELGAENLGQLGAPVVRSSIERKNEGRSPVDFSNDAAAFKQSGRHDLNLRPLGPEPSALPG